MTDLDAALGFVFRRVEEQATQSGEPLSDEERKLLRDLPRYSTHESGVKPRPLEGDGAFEIQLLVRDLRYERLCTAARAAHEFDRNSHPRLKATWEFAANVTKLYNHPAAWLLDRQLQRNIETCRREMNSHVV